MRLKIFRDKYLGVTEDLWEYATYANGGHMVQRFLDCKMKFDTHQWEVLVQWRGLDEAENSWEPARILLEDFPLLLARRSEQTPSKGQRGSARSTEHSNEVVRLRVVLER
ncbi:hypothetical protein ABG067_001210 [Albugo candida]